MRISIFGLGYVGAVSAGCLARDGHQVIGCDIDPDKLALIRDGRTPIIEDGMETLIADAVRSGRLTTTADVRDALQRSDLSFICVGTPSQPNGGQDLAAIARLSRQLGEALRAKDPYHNFVVRSTVIPGTVNATVQPLLEEHSGKTRGKDFGVCFQPEFLREGSSIRDYDHPPLTVVGSEDERATAMLRELFGHLPGEFVATSIEAAEMLKYCCNAFHALKITFANEIGRVSQALGVDPHTVMDLVCRDHQLNISPAYLRPGFAFGGSCLPKDVRALVHTAKHRDVDTPMLAGIMPSNELHIAHAIDMVLRTGRKSVGMIGLSFKSGTDDLRESPLVTMAERFIGKGLDLSIHDPEVNVARLFGANRRYIEETIPHISSLMTEDLAEMIRSAEVIVVGLNDRHLVEILLQEATDNHHIFDLVDIRKHGKPRGRYFGICW